jgi:hypothetical protein
MNELASLVGLSVQSLTRREFDWALDFDNGARLVIECLWRLVGAGRIHLTSQDNAHQFGLADPVDAATEVNRRLAKASVVAVELREGTLDLEMRFDNGQIFQIVPDSSGYEAWNLSNGSSQFIAGGGGELTVFETPR